MATKRRYTVGDTIRLTGAFLRSTGQYAGGDGLSRWTVQTCACSLCGSGRFILTNEPRQDDGMFTPDEIAREPHLKFRHVNSANVERCR